MITGASSDFGCGFIEKYHKNYDTVIAHYNTNKDKLEKLGERCEGKLIPMQADLEDSNSVRRMMQEISERDIMPQYLVHLASKKLVYRRFKQSDIKEYEKEMKCSLFSFLEIMKQSLPYMTEKSYGKIVVMLSSCLKGTPPKFMSSYVILKYALLGAVMSLAEEYADKGICINAVSPDMTDTAFISDIPGMIVDLSREKSVMKRNLSVSETIPTIEYLLSNASDKITAQNIFITGVR